MATLPKTGPLTIDDLRLVWEAATDPTYWRALELAGEGQGFEAYTQAWAQLARVSEAVDRTIQAMYILPWSGQSGPPAAGPQRATVTLQLARTGHVDLPLTLRAGTFVGEVQTDWSDATTGSSLGVPVTTGRRYALLGDLTFEPGEQGPLTVFAQAERPGYGYNNPLIGSITLVDQPGSHYTNIEATIRGTNYPSAFVSTHTFQHVYIDAVDVADAFIPDMVGQYLLLSAGANAGTIARVVGYQPPNLAAAPPTGGTLELELSQSIQSFAGDFTGVFEFGEPVVLKNGGTITGYGHVQDAQVIGGNLFLTFERDCGAAVTTVVGQLSGASATIDVVHQQTDFTMEATAATWVVLDWVGDWGLAVTNVVQPTGGTAGMLDALGKERNIFRTSNESDDHFRQRVAEIADVVTPNAVRRTLNRTIPTLPWCFREAGQPSYPGAFFDHDAYDYDRILFAGTGTGTFAEGEKVQQANSGALTFGRALLSYAAAASMYAPGANLNPAASALPAPTFGGVANIIGAGFQTGGAIVGQKSAATFTPSAITGGMLPANRYKVSFGYLEMRAYFYVGVPPLELGDDGIAYDDDPHGANDAYPNEYGFYDGEPWADAFTYLAVYNAIEKIRAGGVGWQLYIETGPCP